MLKYPGIITKDENRFGQVYWIEFPDFPEISGTQGDTLEELAFMAEDCLGGYIELLIEQEKDIPEPSNIAGDNVMYVNVPAEVAAPILVKKIRKNQNMTQSDVSRKIDKTYRVIQNIERNMRCPSLRTLRKIARAMGKHLEINLT